MKLKVIAGDGIKYTCEICTKKERKDANKSVSRLRKMPDKFLSEDRLGLRNGCQYSDNTSH